MTCITQVKSWEDFVNARKEAVKIVKMYKAAEYEIEEEDNEDNAMFRCNSRDELESNVRKLVMEITGKRVIATASYIDDKINVLSICEKGDKMITKIKLVQDPKNHRLIPVIRQDDLSESQFQVEVNQCILLVKFWDRYIQRINYVEPKEKTVLTEKAH